MLPCQVVALANAEMAKHGLIQRGWRFKLNSNRTRLGVAKFKGIFSTIEISKYLLAMGEARVRNTLMHEIAHAIVGIGHGHNHVWRSKALELGCDGTRCNDFEAPHKYDVICRVHGVVGKRNRLPKRGRHFSCSKCCRGYFNPDYILTYRATGN